MGSKSVLRTLFAAASAKTTEFGVPSSVPKWRAYASEGSRGHEQTGTNFHTWCVVGVRSVVGPCTRAAGRFRANRSIGGVGARGIRCLALYEGLFPAPCHNRMRVDYTILLLWIRADSLHPTLVGAGRDQQFPIRFCLISICRLCSGAAMLHLLATRSAQEEAGRIGGVCGGMPSQPICSFPRMCLLRTGPQQ